MLQGCVPEPSLPLFGHCHWSRFTLKLTIAYCLQFEPTVMVCICNPSAGDLILGPRTGINEILSHKMLIDLCQGGNIPKERILLPSSSFKNLQSHIGQRQEQRQVRKPQSLLTGHLMTFSQIQCNCSEAQKPSQPAILQNTNLGNRH